MVEDNDILSAILRASGQSPEMAAAEYLDAKRRLGGADLAPVVQAYIDQKGSGLELKITVSVLADRFIESRKRAGVSERYLHTLRHQVTEFARAIPGDLSTVRAPLINRWLESLPGCPRTLYNYRSGVMSLMRWAVQQGYLPREWDEFRFVPEPRIPPIEPRILTPEQMSRVLDICPPDLVPFVVLSGFAGVRHEEMNGAKVCLDWRDIDLDERHVYVPKGTAKTGLDRIVPLQPNAIDWLKDFWKPNGRVVTRANTSFALWKIKRAAGVPHGKNETRNSLRKSFISYRMAVVKHIGQVADEAGNSPQMIRKHYRRPIPESEGLRWFSIRPAPEDVLQLDLFKRKHEDL